MNQPAPLEIRNAPTRLMEELGYGRGYQYAHDLEDKVADLECLPESLRGREYYRPTDQGMEKKIREILESIKEKKAKARRAREE
jgi:putative ATPase